MSTIFLETSALVELVFKDAATRAKVRSLIPPGTSTATSAYVLYELHRGFVRNLILLHNKAVQLSFFSELQGYARAVFRKTHLAGTILETFEMYFKEGLTKNIFADHPDLKPDEILLIHFRALLRGKIRRCSAAAMREAQTVINSIGCRTDFGPPTIVDGAYDQNLPRKECGKRALCGLKAYIKRAKEDFMKLRADLQQIENPDHETLSRIRAIRELCRKDNVDFSKSDCYCTADALIVHECPTEHPILTKNRSHMERICNRFGKTGKFYD